MLSNRYRPFEAFPPRPIVSEPVAALDTSEYSLGFPRGIHCPDPVTVGAPSGQSRVVVARPGTRPHLFKARAALVLPLHEIAGHINVARSRRPTQVDLAHTYGAKPPPSQSSMVS